MRCLYHHPLSPPSRLVRLALKEKALEFELVLEKPWEQRAEFAIINPACEVPVLVEDDGAVIAEANAIIEYLEEAYPERKLLPGDLYARAEIRRLTGWISQKFQRDVGQNLIEEKLLRRLAGVGTPNSAAVRLGYANLRWHLTYLGQLADRNGYLAGELISLADLAAAAYLSVLDFIGDVPWNEHQAAREWYARIKSRPSFRPLLQDLVPGFIAPPDYANLDF